MHRFEGLCKNPQGGADEPTEATVDIALRGERNGMGYECIVRQPPARCLGKRGGEGVAVVLGEERSLGAKGVESTGRELVVGKRENVSAPSRFS